MANGEWLTQLMAGLGGAFTGAGQANERMAQEAERERLRQERELEKQRLENQRMLVKNLFKGPMSEESVLRYMGETGDITGGAAMSRFLPEKTKPRTQYDPSRGGIVDVDAGTFRAIPGLPSRPTRAQTIRETGPTKEEEQIGGAWLTNWLGTGDETDRMRRSVLFNQMRKQGIPYGQIGWSLMQSESASGRQTGQDLRNRRARQMQEDDEFNDIEF